MNRVDFPSFASAVRFLSDDEGWEGSIRTPDGRKIILNVEGEEEKPADIALTNAREFTDCLPEFLEKWENFKASQMLERPVEAQEMRDLLIERVSFFEKDPMAIEMRLSNQENSQEWICTYLADTQVFQNFWNDR